MNFLKTKTTWSNWELGLLKLGAGSCYLLIGLYFYEYLIQYIWIFRIACVVTIVWLLIIWSKKEKTRS
ncbi:MAG: hypothetical protein IPM95_02380 [Sphingobacteriales bacterium]|jgi:hypothetical protein|nr:hypothetical protein [Sphingobacteriales bacterium]